MRTEDAVGTRQIETELLGGEVTTVNFGHDYLYYAVRNDGEGTIYVSTENKECTAGGKGVVCVLPGSNYTHYNGYGGNTEIYLSGEGKVTVIAQDDGNDPFKSAAKGGESGVLSMGIYQGAVLTDEVLTGSIYEEV